MENDLVGGGTGSRGGVVCVAQLAASVGERGITRQLAALGVSVLLSLSPFSPRRQWPPARSTCVRTGTFTLLACGERPGGHTKVRVDRAEAETALCWRCTQTRGPPSGAKRVSSVAWEPSRARAIAGMPRRRTDTAFPSIGSERSACLRCCDARMTSEFHKLPVQSAAHAAFGVSGFVTHLAFVLAERVHRLVPP